MNRMHNTSNIRQIIFTICGIACVATILCVAFVFPKYYCLFRDKSTLNKANYMDITVNTYETDYASFPEKIHALARAYYFGDPLRDVPLRAVQVNEPGAGMDQKKLTKIANAEFAKLYKEGVIPQQIKASAKKMTLYQRYTIYETNQKNDFKGISCWKLVFSSKKRIITLYLDEEYHKIYYLKLHRLKKERQDKFAAWGSYSSYDKITDVYHSGYQANFDACWNGLMRYYDLLLYSETINQWPDASNLYGSVEFKDECSIPIFENFDKTTPYYTWSLGLPMDEMIQF